MLCEKRGQKINVSTVLLASSVFVSGNNFEKVSFLARSMNLKYVSSTTFSQTQSLYSLPSIRELRNKMKEIIWKVFENDVLVVCGDGRMDSPGFSAKYCVYTMMGDMSRNARNNKNGKKENIIANLANVAKMTILPESPTWQSTKQ